MVTLLVALVLAVAPGQPARILDFSSQSCPPCRKMAPEIDRLIKAGYNIRQIDIELDPSTTAHYRVDAVPTLVSVDADGNEVGRISGFLTAQEVASWSKGLAAKSRDEKPFTERSATPQPNPSPWETVVRVTVEDKRSTGFGSGTVIHSEGRKALVLTCAHIFADRKKQVLAGQNFDLPIKVELFDGKPVGNPPHTRPASKITGELLNVDFDRDVALVVIEPGHEIAYTKIVPETWTPKVTMRMHSYSCAEGRNPTRFDTVITGIKQGNFLQGRPSYAALECEIAPEQGRSGGGLFTDDGYLAGVTDFAEPNGNKGLYAHPLSIQKLLAHANLADLYGSNEARVAVASPKAAKPVELDEAAFRLFQSWCKRSPPPRGAQGEQGPIGLTGATGANGKDGINGIDGKDGTNGKDGVNGKDGAAAPAGTGTTPAVDLTSILNRLAVLEAHDSLPTKVSVIGPNGTPATQFVFPDYAPNPKPVQNYTGQVRARIGIDLTKSTVPTTQK